MRSDRKKYYSDHDERIRVGQKYTGRYKRIKNYNGVIVTFDFFEGVLARIIKYLTNSSKEKMITEKKSHILFWADFDDAIIEKS